MATWNLNCSCKARQQQEQNRRNFLRMGLKHTCIDRTVVSTDRWFQEQGILRCQVENTLAMITNLKSVIRTPDPVQQIIKIGMKQSIQSCPWIFDTTGKSLSCRCSCWSQHMLQQHILYRQSNHDIAVWTSNHQLSSLWKKNSAARPGGPGRTYFGKIFVINGEQSVVRKLILWFCTCKIARATPAEVNL